jgi:hypothetical protein
MNHKQRLHKVIIAYLVRQLVGVIAEHLTRRFIGSARLGIAAGFWAVRGLFRLVFRRGVAARRPVSP